MHATTARAPLFLVDDNIMLNVKRFEALCEAIIDAGLNGLDYFVQAMTSSIANHGETIAPLMKRAGFRYVFLGIENIIEGDLDFLRASAKNSAREDGRRRRQRDLEGNRAFASARDAGGRRFDRRQPGGHPRVH